MAWKVKKKNLVNQGVTRPVDGGRVPCRSGIWGVLLMVHINLRTHVEAMKLESPIRRLLQHHSSWEWVARQLPLATISYLARKANSLGYFDWIRPVGSPLFDRNNTEYYCKSAGQDCFSCFGARRMLPIQSARITINRTSLFTNKIPKQHLGISCSPKSFPSLSMKKLRSGFTFARFHGSAPTFRAAVPLSVIGQPLGVRQYPSILTRSPNARLRRSSPCEFEDLHKRTNERGSQVGPLDMAISAP